MFRSLFAIFLIGLGAMILASTTFAAEESCYDLGYRYGKCATQIMLKDECAPEDNVVIPDRCKGKEETKKGTKDGAKEVYEAHGMKAE